MSDISRLIIPNIGQSGFYSVKAPFDQFINADEVYTCKAVRFIGDYIALNEDPKTLIYEAYGLTDTDYEADVADNMYIVSLCSESGQWLYIPARYIASYPTMNGVRYHTMMMGVGLGAVPVDMDLSAIQTMVSNLIMDNLGITPAINLVQLSKPILVDRVNADKIEAARLIRAQQKKTDSFRYKETLGKLNEALLKIAELERFILAHKDKLTS